MYITNCQSHAQVIIFLSQRLPRKTFDFSLHLQNLNSTYNINKSTTCIFNQATLKKPLVLVQKSTTNIYSVMYLTKLVIQNIVLNCIIVIISIDSRGILVCLNIDLNVPGFIVRGVDDCNQF